MGTKIFAQAEKTNCHCPKPQSQADCHCLKPQSPSEGFGVIIESQQFYLNLNPFYPVLYQNNELQKNPLAHLVLLSSEQFSETNKTFLKARIRYQGKFFKTFGDQIRTLILLTLKAQILTVLMISRISLLLLRSYCGFFPCLLLPLIN